MAANAPTYTETSKDNKEERPSRKLLSPQDVQDVFDDGLSNCSNLFEFTDLQAMKDRVRENLKQPEGYDVKMYYHETGFWRRIAVHAYFEQATLSVIAVNALWMAIDTDNNKADSLLTAHPVFVAA